MKKVLFNILTCNRFFYFKNCMESLFKSIDLNRIDILVCDNNTIEDGFDEYVNKLSKDYGIIVKKFTNRTRNELYRAMNYAIKYAKKNKYDIINFVQDDIQFVCNHPTLIDDTIEAFKKNDKVVQINYNMPWKRKADRIGKIKTIKGGVSKFAVVYDKSPCDNGFTRVNIYDKLGKYPEEAISWAHGKKGERYKNKLNGEVWFGRECGKKNWKRAITYLPNAGMMFDCAYVRGPERFGRYFLPKNEFYIKYLTDDEREKIVLNNKNKKFSYIEDFCKADGWEPLTYGKHSPINKSHDLREVTPE